LGRGEYLRKTVHNDLQVAELCTCSDRHEREHIKKPPDVCGG
jgi:hypothetical protein